MAVEGKFSDEEKFTLREHWAEGKIEGRKFNVSRNIDGKAIYVEFDGWKKVTYLLSDIVQDAYEVLIANEKLKKEV